MPPPIAIPQIERITVTSGSVPLNSELNVNYWYPRTGTIQYAISDTSLMYANTTTGIIPALGSTVYFQNRAVGTATHITMDAYTAGITNFTIEFTETIQQYNLQLANATNALNDINWRANWVINAPAPYNPQVIAKRKRAEKKANQLLMEFLTLPQKKEYKDKGFFHLESESGKVYRIHKARSHNVKLVEEGKLTKSLCAHPIEGVPDEDTMLAQALMLMTQEQAFLKIANVNNY